ncbi:MAG: hypothetical protein M1484_03455 [Patescibacteria group bacterium]|nr:hypothetical protein [Patescibacteria group bacterium]MCL5432119.1 hypothetical protein [Patescibacteria group bacterium]
MSKRQKFVIATLVLLAGIIVSRAGLGSFLQWRFRVVIFAAASLVASILALHDQDFNGIEWLTLPILPAMFSLGSLLVLPLLPTIIGSGDSGQLLAMALRLAFLGVFVVGYYAALLTANIYNIAAIRTIQLLRVAHSIGFLVTVAAGLLLFIVVSSLHLPSFYNFLLVFIISLPLSFQAIWSVNLEERISGQVRNYSLAAAVILGEIAWILSFWPVTVSIFALFLTGIFYELVGIIQFEIGEKLNQRIANEFIIVAIILFLLTLITTQWGV